LEGDTGASGALAAAAGDSASELMQD
jgi:hypothetical protein